MHREKIDKDLLWRQWETELGLERHRRKQFLIRQEVSVLQDTEYVMELEWLPNGLPQEEEGDDLNPPGTVLVTLDARTRRLRSFHIVRFEEWSGNVIPNEATDQARKPLNLALEWVYRCTGITEQDGGIELVQTRDYKHSTAFIFRRVLAGTPFYPGIQFDVRIGRTGRLVSYASYGAHTGRDIPVLNEPRPAPESSLIRQTAQQMFQLVYVPQELARNPSPSGRWFYGISEAFLDRETGEMMPYEWFFKFFGQAPLNRPIVWNEKHERNIEPMSAQNGSLGEKATKFFAGRELHDDVIPWDNEHPDTIPVQPDEADRVYETVRGWAMKRWPDESGQWMITRILRQSGTLTAILERADSGYEVGLGRTKVFVDSETFAFVDTIELAKMPLHPPELTDKEEAFERIAGALLCKPYYVWDSRRKGYRFMFKLDCPLMVDAQSGEVLEELP